LKFFAFNKAIANLYDLTNTINKQSKLTLLQKESALKSLAMLMMPFTPHIAEEMWLTLGGPGINKSIKLAKC
jgi:leucyl-tRNA synthetase